MNSERWKTETIGDLLSLEYGAGLKESDRSGLDYPVYGSNGVVGYHNKYLVNGPGIIVGRKGSVGAVHWSNDSFWPIDTAYYVETKKENINLRWCYWALQFTELSRLDSSTGVPGLNRNDVYKLEINLPIEQEQLQIARILDAVDEAIQGTDQLIAKLKAIKQGLLHDLLTRGLDENGQLRDPIAYPEQFKDSPLGRIPKVWDVLSIKEFAQVKGGKRLPKGHFYCETPTAFRYLRVLDFFERDVDYYSLEYLKHETYEILKEYEINLGEVYISIAGSIGYAGVCKPLSGQSIVLTENAARIIISNGVDSEFLSIQINSGICKKQIHKEIGTGSGVPKLALHRIERLKIIKPPFEEQNKIVEVVNNYNASIKAEENYLSKLKLLKKGLMHDLLTGKVRVRIDDGEGKEYTLKGTTEEIEEE